MYGMKPKKNMKKPKDKTVVMIAVGKMKPETLTRISFWLQKSKLSFTTK